MNRVTEIKRRCRVRATQRNYREERESKKGVFGNNRRVGSLTFGMKGEPWIVALLLSCNLFDTTKQNTQKM